MIRKTGQTNEAHKDSVECYREVMVVAVFRERALDGELWIWGVVTVV